MCLYIYKTIWNTEVALHPTGRTGSCVCVDNLKPKSHLILPTKCKIPPQTPAWDTEVFSDLTPQSPGLSFCLIHILTALELFSHPLACSYPESDVFQLSNKETGAVALTDAESWPLNQNQSECWRCQGRGQGSHNDNGSKRVKKGESCGVQTLFLWGSDRALDSSVTSQRDWPLS